MEKVAENGKCCDSAPAAPKFCPCSNMILDNKILPFKLLKILLILNEHELKPPIITLSKVRTMYNVKCTILRVGTRHENTCSQCSCILSHLLR